MRTLLLLSAVATLALAQSRPASLAARDAGVMLPVKSSTSDAGVPSPSQTTVIDRAPNPEVERLRRDVTELRSKVTELEQKASKVDSLNADVQRLSKQLDELKGQVTQMKEAEDRRSSGESQVAEQRASTQAATANLNGVLNQLSTGNTSGIDASLRYAEQTYTGTAQRLVQLARQALANGDLNNARSYLLLAISEANTPQR